MGSYWDTGGKLVDGRFELAGSLTKEVTIANGVVFTTTATQFFDLITSGMVKTDIRQLKNWKIHLRNSHNQAATISIYDGNLAVNTTAAATGGLIYTEATILASGGSFTLAAPALAAGAGANRKSVPELQGVFSNILVGIGFGVAPTSGSITIVLEANM